MVSASSGLLLGMIRNHVTTVAAIFFCNLLLGSARQMIPNPNLNPNLLKMIAARHGGHRLPAPSSYLRDFDSQPSGEDDSQLWLDNQAASGSGGSPSGAVGIKGGDDVVSKRFHPSAFFGSRGKRLYARDDEDSDLYLPVALAKRFQRGFTAGRGGRGSGGSIPSAWLLSGGFGQRAGEERERDEEEGSERAGVSKRFDPSMYSGSRGKRYIPGLEALLLSQMYQKLDAEKLKRQSLRGFHAARG